MSGIQWEEAAAVVGQVRAYHQPQDVGDATVEAWRQALAAAGVSSVRDAVQAVVRHYSTPGTDKWITPSDVAAGVRKIRADRLNGVHDGLLMADVPPELPARQWTALLRARRVAVADGVPVAAAIAASPAPAAITTGGVR